jgi:hypothetical protein
MLSDSESARCQGLGHAKAQTKTKPSKPCPSFPLTAHNDGQWCKKTRGKVHFFDVWADPQAALDKYLRVAAKGWGFRTEDLIFVEQ